MRPHSTALRRRILWTTVATGFLPLLIVAWGVRVELRSRIESLHAERLEELIETARGRFEENDRELADRIAAIGARLADDNEIRRVLARDGGPSGLREIAPAWMALAGLDVLQIQDRDRVLSSGHFEEALGRPDPLAVPAAESGRSGLAYVRRPADSILAQVRASRVRIGNAEIEILAGVSAGSLLGTEPGSARSMLVLDQPGQVLLPQRGTPAERVARAATARFGDAFAASSEAERRLALARLEPGFRMAAVPIPLWTREGEQVREERAWIVGVLSSDAEDRARARLDQWLGLGLLIAGALVFAMGQVLARRLTGPLEQLASEASRFHIERRDVPFSHEREDEIGDLGFALERMRRRLHRSLDDLRTAERRVALGDLARQINHDLKNGFLPLRNVFQHLGELSEEDPDQFARVFRERRATLEASLRYLEELSGRYARLAPTARKERVDVHQVIRELLAGVPDDGIATFAELDAETSTLHADPVSLRRVLENLVRNARESHAGDHGRVHVATRVVEDRGVRRLVIAVSDQGAGMDASTRERIFETFYTTKAEGSGLGLGIVRRLVTDMDGRIEVESEVDQGTTFRVSFPLEPGGNE